MSRFPINSVLPKNKFKKGLFVLIKPNKILSVILAMAVLMASMCFPAFAANTFDVTFDIVTDDDATTLPKEAKVKISITGLRADVSTVQVNVSFDGDLKYKTIDYHQGEDKLPHKYRTATDKSTANQSGELMMAIFSLDEPMSFSGTTELCTLTFEGNPGDSVRLTLNKDNTYVNTTGGKIYAKKNITSEAAKATADANEAMTAVVNLVMDKVSGFNANSEDPITLKLTNEKTGKSVSSVLSDDYRTSLIPLTFTVSTDVLAGSTYTVELSGNGYVPYKAEKVDFEQPLKIDNDDFVPGDINKDEKVDSKDKEAYELLIQEKEYSTAADFNRDGYVNAGDNVFANISDDIPPANPDDTPDPTDKPTTTPDGDSDNSGSSGSTDGAGSSSPGGAPGGAPGGGGSSGGGSAGGFGGGISTVPAGQFVDLVGYDWASSSIYALKEKGIISGTSDTTYSPANNIKRGDFILILTRMLAVADPFTENFADVPEGSYYYNAIGSAKAAGIAQGSGDSFMPEASITRQDLITLAYRAFLAKGYITASEDVSSLNAFADKALVSDYAAQAMASMVNAGIIQGSGGNVNPLGYATRAEVAVMCARLVALIG